jgi:hypothetical protein
MGKIENQKVPVGSEEKLKHLRVVEGKGVGEKAHLGLLSAAQELGPQNLWTLSTQMTLGKPTCFYLPRRLGLLY